MKTLLSPDMVKAILPLDHKLLAVEGLGIIRRRLIYREPFSQIPYVHKYGRLGCYMHVLAPFIHSQPISLLRGV